MILGVSKPAYTEQELEALDPPPFTYEGKQYTAYKAQQQMRKMERAMRKQKDRCIVADAAGDTQAFTAASIKLQRQKDIYEDFCKAAGTYTEYERTFVAGYGRRLGTKTGAVTRAQNRFKNAQITLNQNSPLTNGGNSGIIKNNQTHLADKFTVAQSIEKAKEYARDVLKFDYYQYDKFNLDVANMVNRELAKAYDIFGNIHDIGYLDGIMYYPKKSDWVAAYSPAFHTIFMKNVSAKNALVQMAKEARGQFEIGFWSDPAAEHAIRHEFGHAVQHCFTDNNADKLKRISLLREKILRDCKIPKWDINDTPEHTKKAGEFISYYALRDDGEFIAESVAEFLNGNPRDTAKKVVEILLEKGK